jgi:conjugal transfer pilus assembly protein TraV
MKRLFLLAMAAVLVSGCSLLNPYKSDFACPDYDRGKCAHVEDAYKESLKGKRDNKATVEERAAACRKCREQAEKSNLPVDVLCSSCAGRPEKGAGASFDHGASKTDTLYQREVNKKLTGMLKKPNTPLLAPPKIMRVLMLPYKGDGNELYMMRYIYLMADEPRWVVGDYLIDREEGPTR